MDAGSAPERIGEAYLPDQPPNFEGYLGLPARRRDFQRQKERKPARCQRRTVSGSTIVIASRMRGAIRYRQTKIRRSNCLGPGVWVRSDAAHSTDDEERISLPRANVSTGTGPGAST